MARSQWTGLRQARAALHGRSLPPDAERVTPEQALAENEAIAMQQKLQTYNMPQTRALLESAKELGIADTPSTKQLLREVEAEHAAEYDSRMAAEKQMSQLMVESQVELARQQYEGKKAQEARAIQTGVRGGQFYVGPTGQKVYVKPNPGVELLGTVQPTPFVSGLPQSVSMNQPNTGSGVQQSMMFGNRPR